MDYYGKDYTQKLQIFSVLRTSTPAVITSAQRRSKLQLEATKKTKTTELMSPLNIQKSNTCINPGIGWLLLLKSRIETLHPDKEFKHLDKTNNFLHTSVSNQCHHKNLV